MSILNYSSTKRDKAGNKIIGTLGGQNVIDGTSGESKKKQSSLPDREEEAPKNTSSVGDDTTGLLSASLPSVNDSDIASTVRRELSPARKALSEKYGLRIGEAQEEKQGNIRALEGALGTRRRFSSSASAFVQWSNDQYNKKIADLESQRDIALAEFDVNLANAIQSRIQQERIYAQQDFENMMKVLESEGSKKTQKEEDFVQSEQEAAIIEAMANGAETVVDIFNKSKEVVEDITLDDVTSAMEALGKRAGSGANGAADKLTGDAKNFFILKENYPDSIPAFISTLPEAKQLGAYIQWMEGGAKGTGVTFGGTVIGGDNVTPGSDAYEKNIMVARIGKQIYGTRISDAESKRVESFITAGMKKGKSSYDIIDDVLGFTVERNKPMANNMRDILIQNAGEEGLASMDMLGLARLINSGNDSAAIQKFEDMVYAKSKEIDPDSFLSEAAVRITTQQVNDLMTLLESEDLIEEVGTFQGTMTEFLTKKFRGEKATELKNRVTNLSADMRKTLAGVNVTETELLFLEPLVPDIDQPAASFIAELRNLKVIPQLKLNQIRDDRGLPEIDEKMLFDRKLRQPLYSGIPKASDVDFFDAPVPADTTPYSPDVWGNAQPSFSSLSGALSTPFDPMSFMKK